MNSRSTYDLIILGSGAGGSLLAGILARSGMCVAIIDHRKHPRFTIGESSTPAANLILRSLSLKYNLPELLPLTRFGDWQNCYPDILCGCKRGFSYFWHDSKNEYSTADNHQHELLVTANSSREKADTQWYRPDVDQFLSNVAQKHSASLFENAKQIEIEHPAQQDWLVTFNREAKSETLRSRFIVDATGENGVLLNRLNVPLITEKLQTNSSVIYSHWDHVVPVEEWIISRGDSCQEHPFLVDDSAVHHLYSDGWMWQLRFENGLTSLGFLSQGGFNDEINIATPAQAWESLLQSKPSISTLLSQAKLAPFPGKVYRSGRLQRLRKTACGPDWAALPFSVGFIDPLHSTGIAHTFSGIERLSQILLEESGTQQESSLKKYSQGIIEELRLIDLLVAGCYESLSNFPLFTAWTMLYFAAATTFEKRYQLNSGSPPAFLCANDVKFVTLVQELYKALIKLPRNGNSKEQTSVDNFINSIKQQLAPFNHVGLFEPDVPNMYRYTSVD